MKRAIVLLLLPLVSIALMAAFGSDDPKQGEEYCCYPTMVAISAPGTFVVGSPVSDPYRTGEETPATITLNYGWRVSDTEITKRQWRELMHESNSFFWQCDDCPQDVKSWTEATQFADRLSALQGLQQCYSGGFPTLTCTGYRLPTAAEFEWMHRAGDTYPDSGVDENALPNVEACVQDTFLDGKAVYCHAANVETTGMPGPCVTTVSTDAGDPSICITTLPVKSTAPNAFGLYGMAGNLYEWTHSNWCGTSWQALNPTGDECSPDPVVKEKRGGSFLENSKHQRHSMRSYDLPTRQEKNIGFRLVLNGTGT